MEFSISFLIDSVDWEELDSVSLKVSIVIFLLNNFRRFASFSFFSIFKSFEAFSPLIGYIFIIEIVKYIPNIRFKDEMKQSSSFENKTTTSLYTSHLRYFYVELSELFLAYTVVQWRRRICISPNDHIGQSDISITNRDYDIVRLYRLPSLR